jgi:hypothetical protein
MPGRVVGGGGFVTEGRGPSGTTSGGRTTTVVDVVEVDDVDDVDDVEEVDEVDDEVDDDVLDDVLDDELLDELDDDELDDDELDDDELDDDELDDEVIVSISGGNSCHGRSASPDAASGGSPTQGLVVVVTAASKGHGGRHPGALGSVQGVPPPPPVDGTLGGATSTWTKSW